MTWARIEDDFYNHPNFADVPLDELGLWVCMVAYCNRNLTDGFVPESAVRKFGSRGNGLRVAGRLASRSVLDRFSNQSRSILERAPNGFRIVGYLDHNPSRREVEAKLDALEAKKRAAGIAGGLASGRARRRNDSDPPKQTRSTLLQENEADAKHAASPDRSSDEAGVLQPNEARSSPLLFPPNPQGGKAVANDSEKPAERPSGTFPASSLRGEFFADEASSWAAGIRDVTGGVSPPPRGRDATDLGELVRIALPDEPAKWSDWLRADAAAFARVADRKYGLSVKRYVEWVRAGRQGGANASSATGSTRNPSGRLAPYHKPFTDDD